MIMDTFGCTPKFLAENPKAAKALADGYFAAVDMIAKEPKKSFEIMGADVKQSAEQFEASQKYLRWQDRAANKAFFAGPHAQFSKEAADLLLEIGIIKQIPDLSKLADAVHPVAPAPPVPRATACSAPARGAGDGWVRGARCLPAAMNPRSRQPGAQDRARHRVLRPVRRRVEHRHVRRFRVEDLPRRSAHDAGGRVSCSQYGFAKDVAVTVWRVLGGFVLAALIGVPLGIAMGAYKPIEAFFEPFVSFARYLPASAFIPLLILWAGIGETQKLLVIFIGVFFQIVLMVAVIVGSTRRDLVEAAYTLGATRAASSAASSCRARRRRSPRRCGSCWDGRGPT
jgi:hypothetical protein